MRASATRVGKQLRYRAMFSDMTIDMRRMIEIMRVTVRKVLKRSPQHMINGILAWAETLIANLLRSLCIIFSDCPFEFA